jgi:short-subunit dehydrogenase
MNSYFSNKHILITGASSGIGSALAVALAQPSVHLILVARNLDKLQSVSSACTAKGASTEIHFLDVSIESEIVAFAQKLKQAHSHLDILINNAGISQRSQAEETPLMVDRRIMEVNFFGQVNLTKQLWPLLCNAAHANIVLISSVVGTFGFPQRSAYSASKHALEGFFESWMLENKRDNIFFEETLESKITKYKNKKVLKNSNGKDFNLFKDGFWQGHKGLVLTFWGFFVGGNILFNAATMILEDNPTLLIFNLIFCVIWNVLSVIGVFNAADIYKAEKIKKGFPYTAATVAKVVVVLLILSAIGNNIPK